MRIAFWFTALLFVAAAATLLAVRPAAALAVGVVLCALSVWRMPARVRASSRRRSKSQSSTTVQTAAVSEQARTAYRPDPALADRVRAAGWAVEAASSGAPWVVAAAGDVRVALRPSPRGLRATSDDIMEALAAKAAEEAQYVAIICGLRPEDEVTARAKAAQVHIVNLARLEAYLTLASSFQQPQAARAVTA